MIIAATWPVEAGSVTSGTHARRDCLAASRAVDRHRASERAPRSPVQTATQRAAVQGTMRSTPTSVRPSTAASPRSPFGMAWTTVIAGSGRGTSRLARTARSAGAAAARDHALGHQAGAVADVGALARTQPADGGRVPPLGPGQDDDIAVQVLTPCIEDGRLRHRRPRVSAR